MEWLASPRRRSSVVGLSRDDAIAKLTDPTPLVVGLLAGPFLTLGSRSDNTTPMEFVRL